ncbi:MAG TPA: hypothetical protein PKA48_13820, partial [Candidatus Obscuribacter sp.]|nr:hypothetical protein [Candidatus Obscuribacter sp.]
MTGTKDKPENTGSRALAYYGTDKLDVNQPRLPESVDQIRRFWLTPEVEEALRDHCLVSSIAHVRMLA